MHSQPLSRRRMTSHAGPLPFISRQRLPGYPLSVCFDLAQLGKASGGSRRRRKLLHSVYFAAHMVCRNHSAAGFRRQALDHKPQLAHIPKPFVMTEQFQGPFLEFDEWVIAPDENRNICGVFSESRHPDRVNAQAIIETAAKAAFIDFAEEIAIGRGDESCVYFYRLRPSDSFEFTFLKDA